MSENHNYGRVMSPKPPYGNPPHQGRKPGRAENIESRKHATHSDYILGASSIDIENIKAIIESVSNIDELKMLFSDQYQSLQTDLIGQKKSARQRIADVLAENRRLKKALSDKSRQSELLLKKIGEIEVKAATDSLTGLHNRSAFEERLSLECKRSRRYGNSLSLIVIDIDHFKKINDSFGHQAGDKTLQCIGKTISEAIRDVDFSARYGGEEFVVILPQVKIKDAYLVAEKIRTSMAACTLNVGGHVIAVTVSCGVAQISEHESDEELFKRADEALYSAKRNGRNRCVINRDNSHN